MQDFTIQKLRGGLAVSFLDKEGKRRRYALTAKTKKDATPEAMEIVEEFFKIDPGKITVAEIIEKYVEHLRDRPAGHRLKSSKVLISYFGSLKPSQITDEVVYEYTRTRVHAKTNKPVKNETLWTELGGLRDAISFAKKRKLINPDDVPYIERPSKAAPRDRPLSREEVSRLLKASKAVPHLHMAILLLLGTAGRVSAVLQLEWDRVDFSKNTIDLRLDSNGPTKGRAMVPMNPGLREELLKWKAISSSQYVVSFSGEPIKSIKTAFTTALAASGLENVRIHDLRHTAAVWMLRAGSSIQRISQYLGHTSLDQTFKVYARYQPDFLRAEAAALDVSDLTNPASGSTKQVGDKTRFGQTVRTSKNEVALVVNAAQNPAFAKYISDKGPFLIETLFRFYEIDRDLK